MQPISTTIPPTKCKANPKIHSPESSEQPGESSASPKVKPQKSGVYRSKLSNPGSKAPEARAASPCSISKNCSLEPWEHPHGPIINKGFILQINPESHTPFPDLNTAETIMFRHFLEKWARLKPSESIAFLDSIYGAFGFHPALGQEMDDISDIRYAWDCLEARLDDCVDVDFGKPLGHDATRQFLWLKIERMLMNNEHQDSFISDLEDLAGLVGYNFKEEAVLMRTLVEAWQHLNKSKVAEWGSLWGTLADNLSDGKMHKQYAKFCEDRWLGYPIWKSF